jgi:hypothetical protein
MPATAPSHAGELASRRQFAHSLPRCCGAEEVLEVALRLLKELFIIRDSIVLQKLDVLLFAIPSAKRLKFQSDFFGVTHSQRAIIPETLENE